jgi:predicted Zn-dependent protease
MRVRWTRWLIAALAVTAAVAAPAVKAQTLIRDTEIEETLRGYATPIYTAAGLNERDVRTFVVGDRSINAFVTQGQNVFLHTGLIMEADNPNQLKGVIAHEAGHIAGGHLARSDDAIRSAMVPAYVTIALGLLALASGAGDAGAALLASSQQFALLSFLRFSQVQESSADQAAVGYLETTGQSPRGLLEFFDTFRYQEVMSEARRDPWFRSHPLSRNRIEALRKRVDQSPFRDVVDTPEDMAEFRMMQAKIQGFLYAPQRTFQKYPASDASLPARYARAVAAFRTPDVTTAVAETRALIAEQPDNPYFHELLGQILFESGRVRDSLEPNRKALSLKPDAALLRINLARTLVALEDPELMGEAETVLKAALRAEPDNAFAWRQLSIVYDRKGMEGLARLASAEEAYALGDSVRANQFAGRAESLLTSGTPDWRRASDIMLVTRDDALKAQRRGGPAQRRLADADAAALSSVRSTAPAAHDHGDVHHTHTH